MALTAAEIAERVRGEVLGDASTLISGIAPADAARPGDITFAENDRYFAAAEQSHAAAILVSGPFTSTKKVLIRVTNARIAMARLLPLFFPPERPAEGIHPSAVIDSSAQVDPTAHVGPNCVIGPRVRIGARSALMAGNYIGHDCRVGDDVCLHPNVLLYPRTVVGHRVIIHGSTVIGSDGYGYVLDEGVHRKVLQLGNVVIHDDVEIGANAAIDRGALGSTVIGQGTKIDNLVHVAHNVAVGRHCLIMGQAGFAGSTRLGDYCVIASQSGIAGHLNLGRQATVGAKSGVMRDVPDGETVLGIPAMPDRQTKRGWIGIQQLPEMTRRLKELEKQVQQLRDAAAGQSSAARDPA
ncbi:MAG: UDP-3-O-(3-hydroxymyristoyl)glucosamine N-acyltransferase [Verrucomicrobia subdivision 3 bacterium]|nr:UDP-3-O-(3-hydroxymyristoyl)glucosamine N-acyltransferase [Limisphaerales bacterium]